MTVALHCFQKRIIKHKCKVCGLALCESGYLRRPDVKEVRMLGAWKKENYRIKTLASPFNPRHIISIDLSCRCSNCGMPNTFILATGLDSVNKIKVQYNQIVHGQGVLIQ